MIMRSTQSGLAMLLLVMARKALSGNSWGFKVKEKTPVSSLGYLILHDRASNRG